MAEDDPTPTPQGNPDADELAALRKEKADREAAAAAERDKELADLRAYRAAEEERKAKAVKAPTPKADKTPPADPPAPSGGKPEEKPAKKKSHVSSTWFGKPSE